MTAHAKRYLGAEHRGGKSLPPTRHGRAPAVHYVERDVDAFTVWTACQSQLDVSKAVTVAEEVTCLKCIARMNEASPLLRPEYMGGGS